MMIGAEQSEWTIRSTSLDEPVTPSNFNLKESSSWGSASVPPVRLDGRLLFTDASRTKILEAALAADQDDYVPVGLTTIVPEIGAPGFVRMAAQRRPETRVHAVRADGKVAVLVTDPFENIRCWILVETDGSVEDVVVLPATNAVEDSVYYLVARRIGDRTVRYWERWAAEADCIGGTVNAQADSYYNYDGASTSTITGLDHLEGREVVVWADGRDLSPDDDTRVQRLYTVTGGALTLDAPVSKAVIGLPYRARWKSTKLAYGAQNGTALSQTKRVDAIGALLADTHAKGLYFGPDFTTMDPLPAVEDGGEVAPDHIHEDYDKGMVEFPGDWSADSRVCLEARAPRPCTAMALSVSVITHER